jgi:hypothetical protein
MTAFERIVIEVAESFQKAILDKAKRGNFPSFFFFSLRI